MPIAVDTNVLARALTDDGSEQSRQASECLRVEQILIPDTVLLETEWGLRSSLNIPRSTVASLFSALVPRSNIGFTSRMKVADILQAYRSGFDFADAMHLFSARGCSALLTFDKDFLRRSRGLQDVPPVKHP